MKKVLIYATAVSLLLSLLPALVFAQGTGPKAALHVKAHAIKAVNICPSGPAPEDPLTMAIDCADYVTSWPTGAAADIYLCVVANTEAIPSGISGLECGIGFDPAISMSAWTLCSDLEFHNDQWPNSGGKNRMTWALPGSCQNTSVGDNYVAITGSFYVYPYAPGGTFFLTNWSGSGNLKFNMTNCAGPQEIALDDSQARIEFSDVGDEGCNPCVESCGTVPTRSVTWGEIKSSYEE